MGFDPLEWLGQTLYNLTHGPTEKPVAAAPQPSVPVVSPAPPAPASTPRSIERIKVPTSNYSAGRRGTLITHIIIHTMQGTYEGTKSWFAQAQAGTSAHYGISFEGDVCQFVADEDTAYHAGNMLYNRCSIGIELEGFQEKGYFPEPMLTALATLIKELSSRHNIVLDREHIVGHNEVPDPYHAGEVGGAQHHKDPGAAFPWDKLMASLKNANV